MRQFYILLLFVIAVPNLLPAQCWESQSTPTTAQLRANYFTDAQTGWACGANGTLLHTTNGGENWAAQSSGVSTMLYDLFFTNSNNGWAVGSRGTILKTSNGGSSWSAQDAGTATDLYGIYMANANEGWITGACGLLLRTTNGGSSWQQQSSGLSYHLYDVAFNGSLGIATGGNGTVLRSTDGGNSWQSGFTSGSGNWRGLAVQGSGFVIANTDGEVGVVNANGTGYTPVNTPAGSWQGIAVATEQDWYLCGRNGTLLRTADAGNTWTSESTNTNADLYGISVIPGADAWATGGGGTLVSACSSNPPAGGGGTVGTDCWALQSTPTTAQLRATHFTDAQTGWACGANGTLLHTTNGGENWGAQSPGVNTVLYDLFFTDSNTGWAVGSRGTILKTTNGGSSWAAQDAGTATDLYGIYMANATEGWITGACGLLLHTTNGGSSWQQQSSGLSYHLYDVAFNGSLGIATGSNGTVLRSTDGGNSWQSGFTSGSGNWRGLAVQGSSFVVANTDGEVGMVNTDGTGYTPMSTPVVGRWQSIGVATEDIWYVAGLDGTVLRTEDAGSTWITGDAGTNADWYDLSFTDASNGWVVGSQGTIVKICSTVGLTCDPVQDSLALVALYNATDGPNWTNSWDLSQPVATWNGVVFDAAGDCITALLLDNNNLNGTLPDPMPLTRLQNLVLTNNPGLTGALPNFEFLPALEFVALFENSFSGVIPENMNLPELFHFDVSDNQLSGGIPVFSGTPNLQYLDLRNNQLSGAIPDLSHLSQLYYWSLFINNFETPIPDLSAYPSLDTFSIAENGLTFEDILPTHDASTGALNFFDYSTQDSIYQDTLIEVTAGTTFEIDLGIDAGISNSNYLWYRDGNVDAAFNSNTRQFNNVTVQDAGVYRVEVTNPGAPNLALYSRNIEVRVCPVPVQLDTVLCAGESYLFNGQNLTSSGIYDAIFTTANGCDSTVTLNLQVDPEPGIAGTPNTAYQVCENEPLPTLILNPTAGAIIYWYDAPTGGNLLHVDSSSYYTPVSPGNYFAEVRQVATGCPSLQRLMVSVVQSPFLITQLQENTCQPNATGLDTVVLTASFGCDSLVVTNTTYIPPADLFAGVGPDRIANCGSCATANFISASATQVSENPNVAYEWTATQGGQICGANDSRFLLAIGPGTFIFEVRDESTGCAVRDTLELLAPDLPSIEFEQTTPGEITCSTSSVTVSVTEEPDVEYNWSGPNGFNANTREISVSEPGNYIIAASFINSECSATDTITINEDIAPPIAIAQTEGAINCQTETITLSAMGSTQGGEIQYTWLFTDLNEVIGNSLSQTTSNPGEYVLTVENMANSCIDTDTVWVEADTVAPVISNINITPTDCGFSNGQIELETAPIAGLVSFQWSNGMTSQNLNNIPSGTYGVTVTNNTNGCAITEMFTIPSSSTVPPTNIENTLCAGETLVVGGIVYDESNPTGTNTLTAANGCDSIVNVNLSFLPSIENTLSAQICTGESYAFNGQNLNSSGTYDAIFTAANGCDSTVTLNLQVDPEPGITGTPNTEYQVCEDEPMPTLTLNPTVGATIDWYDAPAGGNLLQAGNSSYTPAAPGTYFAEVRQVATGCTSLQRLLVSVVQPPVLTTQLEATTCLLEEEGLDTVVLTATFGCDSLVVTNTTYIPPAAPTVLTATTCLEDEVGSDTLLLQTTEGCDSLVITNTTLISPPAPTILNLTTCLESEVGSDTLLLQTSEGCDSLVITTITYQPAGPPTFAEVTTCLESEAGVDTLQFQDVQGCDSTVILTTSYEPIPVTEVAETTCDWEAVGTDIQVFTTAEGCDSVVQYQYTFEPALITTLPDAASCNETEWGRDTTFLTTPGGCDSLLIQETLQAPPAETVLDTQICAGESLLFGSQLIEGEGTYNDTLFTVAGCDSIITLNVAVTSDAPVPITEYLCPGDTIIIGGNLITGSGQFNIALTDQFGCDSTIQLTVESIDAEAFSLTPDEQIILEGNTSATFFLTDNDQLPPDYTLELTQLPLHGTASVSEGELTYDLTNPSFLGVDSFGYRVCTQLCIDTCLEASIRISTLADCLTEIQANLPTGFTPDGDGFNDVLHPLREVIDVGCLQGPERATMRVLNRWGEVVFEADPYREWDGRYTNGQIVPQGTYYYILTFELDGENVITQYVHVLRTE